MPHPKWRFARRKSAIYIFSGKSQTCEMSLGAESNEGRLFLQVRSLVKSLTCQDSKPFFYICDLDLIYVLDSDIIENTENF